MSDLSNDWDIAPRPLIPPRSRLYCMLPVGLGTELVESLASYVCRLAEAHSLAPWILVTREVSPLASLPTLRLANEDNRHNRRCDIFGKVGGSSLMSNGLIAADAVRVMEQLTLRNDLANLTALFTDGVLSSRGLLAKNQKWCPQCFQSWQFASRPIHLPLMWQFQQATVCIKHNCRLQEHCPHCGSTALHISRKLQPGFCAQCFGWLGTAAQVEPDSPDVFDSFATEQIGKIIVNASKIKAQGKGGWSRSMSWIVENWTAHAEGFARNIGVSPSTLRDWIAGLSLPSLTLVTGIAYQLQLDATDLLVGRVDYFAQIKNGGLLRPLPKLLKPKNRKHDIEALKQVMRDAMLETPPPSLASISKKTKIHTSFLTRKFPELAHEIKTRYQQVRSSRKAQRNVHVAEVVRATVAKIVAKDQYPGMARMRRTLPKDVSMLEPVARKTWLTELAARNLVKPTK